MQNGEKVLRNFQHDEITKYCNSHYGETLRPIYFDYDLFQYPKSVLWI